MMTKFTLPFLPILIVLFSSFFYLNSNQFTPNETNDPPIYKRVEVTLNSLEELRKIGALGIDMKCGVTSKVLQGKTVVRLEISEMEYNQIVASGMTVKVLIEDLSKFYETRAMQLLPQAEEELEERKLIDQQKNFAHDMGCTENTYPVPSNFNLGSMGGFLTYTELLADLDKMANLYPNLITIKASASTTGQTTHQGRTVYYVKVSDNPNTNEAEPQVLYTGLHHAREPGSMMNINYYLWYLLENYNSDATVKDLVDHTEMYFIPVVNPDGYIYNETTNPGGGGFWRKNRRNNGDGTFGVDLNRNYGYQWGFDNAGSSPSTSSDVYRGPSPFSEPETQIVKSFAENHNFVNAFNNHSYSNLFLHPWGYANIPTPDETLFGEMSEHMCWHNRYRYGRPSTTIFYEANGDSDSWFYGEQTSKNKTMAFTPEVGSGNEGGFYPSPTFIVDQCERHLHMSLVLAETAANHGILNDLTPYGINSLFSKLSFNVQHLSLTPGSFTVKVTSNNPNVTLVNTNPTTAVLSGTNNQVVSKNLSLTPGLAPGTSITFNVVLNNGTYDIYSTTITKLYTPSVIFTDDCNSLANWNSTSWGVDNSTGYNANGSLTDSPSGFSTNGVKTITMAAPVDFSTTQNPVLEYYTKWDITRLFSYTQIEISTNGSSWTALCAENTKVGVSDINSGSPNQPAGEALYDGFQENFVREQFDLSTYVGFPTVYFRFIFNGDSEVAQSDGFWFDDFTIYEGNQCISAIVENTQSPITNDQSAIISIETDGVHDGSTNIIYNAGDYLQFNSGFCTDANFQAIIEACQ